MMRRCLFLSVVRVHRDFLFESSLAKLHNPKEVFKQLSLVWIFLKSDKIYQLVSRWGTMVGNSAFKSRKYTIFIVARVTTMNWTCEHRAFVIDVFITNNESIKAFWVHFRLGLRDGVHSQKTFYCGSTLKRNPYLDSLVLQELMKTWKFPELLLAAKEHYNG